MKMESNENPRSKIILISLVILSSFLLVINFIPIFGSNEGFSTDLTEAFNSNREAYVNKSNPDMNYSYKEYFFTIVGNSCEAYINFNLDLVPEETDGLYFFVRDYYKYESYQPIDDLEVNVILVDSGWNSSEITWNNKPVHNEIIDTVKVSEIYQMYILEHYNLENTINITNIFKNTQQSDLSFCINITDNNLDLDEDVYLYIQLIWVNNVIILSYTNIFTTVMIISLLIGTLLYMRKKVYSCPNCNTKRNLIHKSCSSCGYTFEDNLIVYSSDYQLALILLWIFFLFEGNFIIIMMVQIIILSWQSLSFSFPFIIIWTIICSRSILKKIKRYKSILRNREKNRLYKETYKYICSACGKFAHTLRDYCDICGEKGSLREANAEDYENYWKNKSK